MLEMETVAAPAPVVPMRTRAVGVAVTLFTGATPVPSRVVDRVPALLVTPLPFTKVETTVVEATPRVVGV